MRSFMPLEIFHALEAAKRLPGIIAERNALAPKREAGKCACGRRISFNKDYCLSCATALQSANAGEPQPVETSEKSANGENE